MSIGALVTFRQSTTPRVVWESVILHWVIVLNRFVSGFCLESSVSFGLILNLKSAAALESPGTDQ